MREKLVLLDDVLDMVTLAEGAKLPQPAKRELVTSIDLKQTNIRVTAY